jgi:hypothetical protein
VAFVSIVIGFVVVTAFSLAGMLITRRREQDGGQSREIAEKVAKIDEASDAALAEINKTAVIVTEEINEKYQSMLFLYNLLEDKKKEITLLVESAKTPLPKLEKTIPNKKPRNKKHPHYDEIMQLMETGLSAAEIAKELNIGKGEVQLILDLAKFDINNDRSDTI